MEYLTIGISIAGFICTLITVWAGLKKQAREMQKERAEASAAAAATQARTEEQLKELTREVRKHNGFAERLPVVENDIQTLYKRLGKLEDRHND